MYAKRIIPCLDIKDGRVVKGINFLSLRDAGDPVEVAAAYSMSGADEVVFLDITATHEGRATAAELAAGLVLNVWLGLGIWDYSGLFGNLWGQICPQFWALWCLLAGPVIVAFDWLDYLSGAGDRPSYKWI